MSGLVQVDENRFGFMFWLCRGLLSVVLKLIFFGVVLSPVFLLLIKLI